MLRHIYGMIVCVVLVIPAIADAFLFPQKLSRRVDGPLPGSPAYGGQPLAEWISLLDSKDQQVRREALIAVGKIGRQAEAAVPELLKRIKDEDAILAASVVLVVSFYGKRQNGRQA
jgi:hypothetical protein